MEFEYTEDKFLILPLLGICAGECEDPACDAVHYRLTIGWMFWQLHFDLP